MIDQNEAPKHTRYLSNQQDLLGMSLKTATERMFGEGMEIQLPPEKQVGSEELRTYLDSEDGEVTGRPIISIYTGKNLHDATVDEIDDPAESTGIVYKVVDLRPSGEKYKGSDFVLIRQRVDYGANDITPIPTSDDPEAGGVNFGRSYSAGENVDAESDLEIPALRAISRNAGQISVQENPYTGSPDSIRIHSTSRNNLYVYSGEIKHQEAVNRLEPRALQVLGAAATASSAEVV